MKAKKGPARAYSCKRGHRLDYKTRYTSPLGNSKCRKCAALHIKHMQKKQGKVYQLAKKLIAAMDDADYRNLPLPVYTILESMQAEIEQKLA